MTLFTRLKSAAVAAFVTLGLSLQAAPVMAGETRTLTVAGGCFWCVEADFEKVPGVKKAVSGYTGGTTANPTYKKVTRGGTGHYEAVQITYDSGKVSVETLLNKFFRSVDPTDAGGQFCDRGESYRTAIFVSNPAEKAAAETAKADAAKALGKKIVTPILSAKTFYDAEDYHQDYYKGSNIVLSRFGPVKQSKAYKKYREGCGRDARVKQLWGKEAAFVGG